MKIFPKKDHDGAGNFKTFLLYRYHLIDVSQTYYEDIGRIQGHFSWQSAKRVEYRVSIFGQSAKVEYRLSLFLAIAQVLKILWPLENFKMGSQWENLKCGIFRKRLIVERNGQKFGTLGTTVHYGRYFWCPIPWVWFGVIRCTLQNFRFYDF